MSDNLKLFKVEFEIRETVIYSVYAENEDDAIEKAQCDADLDYDGNADYYQSWEVIED